MTRQNQKSIFLYVFIVWYVTEILFNTTLTQIFGVSTEELNNIVNYLVLVFMMLQIIFLQKYTMRELCLIAASTVPIVVSAALSLNFSVLSSWLFIVAAKDTEFERIVHTAYKVLLVMLPLIIALYLLGVIEDFTILRNGMLRYSLGFSHPNQLGLRVFQLTACHCYLNRDNMRVINYISILAAAVFLYIVPNSQTAYVCALIMLLLLLVYKFVSKHFMEVIKAYQNSMVIMAVLFNLLSMLWSMNSLDTHPIVRQINTWMSIRFSSGYKVLQIYGISMLGQRIYVSSAERQLAGITTSLYLDNAYMALLLRFGVMVYVIFSLAFIGLIIYCKRRGQTVLMIILVVYALYGVMETGLFMMSHNIFLIVCANMLYRKGFSEARNAVSKRKVLYKNQGGIVS